MFTLWDSPHPPACATMQVCRWVFNTDHSEQRLVTRCCLSSEQMPSSVWLQPCEHIWLLSPALRNLWPWICSASLNTKPRTCTTLEPTVSIFQTSSALLPNGWRRPGPGQCSVAGRTAAAAALSDPQVRGGEYKPSQRISDTDYKSVRTVWENFFTDCTCSRLHKMWRYASMIWFCFVFAGVFAYRAGRTRLLRTVMSHCPLSEDPGNYTFKTLTLMDLWLVEGSVY